MRDHMLDLSAYPARRVGQEPSLRLMAPVTTLTPVCLEVPELSPEGHTALLAGPAEEGTALLGPAVVDRLVEFATADPEG